MMAVNRIFHSFFQTRAFKLLSLILVCVLAGCNTTKFVYYATLDQKTKRFYLKLPEDFLDHKAMLDSTGSSMAIFYLDSTYFYVSQSKIYYSPNIVFVKIEKSRQDSIAVIQNYKGRFDNTWWREVRYKDQLWLGYYTLSDEYKSEFDKPLDKTYHVLDKHWKKQKRKE